MYARQQGDKVKYLNLGKWSCISLKFNISLNTFRKLVLLTGWRIVTRKLYLHRAQGALLRRWELSNVYQTWLDQHLRDETEPDFLCIYRQPEKQWSFRIILFYVSTVSTSGIHRESRKELIDSWIIIIIIIITTIIIIIIIIITTIIIILKDHLLATAATTILSRFHALH